MSQTSFEVLRPRINTNDSVISQTGGFDGPQEPDSGYASAAHSTPNSSEKTPKSSTVDGGPAAKQTLDLASLKGAGDLIAFNKEIDRATGDRFRDILDRLEAPLFTYMQKSFRKHRPMALRLMVLGRTEAEAKLCIVALCHEDRVKRVQRFFDKSYVKEICRPQDPTIPSFEVTVIGQAPRTRSGGAIDVHMDMLSSTAGARSTCCGTLVKLSSEDKHRLGTLGGLIKVTSISGEYTLYGMVAGHLVEEMEPAGSDLTNWTSPSWLEKVLDCSEEDSDWDSAEEGAEENDTISDTPVPCDLQTHHAPLSKNSTLQEAFRSPNKQGSEKHEWQPIGQVFTGASAAARASHFPVNQRAHDWSLVGFSSEFDLKPNMLNDKSKFSKTADLKVPLKSITTSSAALPVVISSGAQGLLPGTLSPLPCSYWSGFGNKFVRAISFSLREGAVFSDGDSGAWVIDKVAFEVHGHLVASDMFGDGYVIPILDTLEDIKQQFNATLVDLPSALDVKFMPRPGQQSRNNTHQQSSGQDTQGSNPGWLTPPPARWVTPNPDTTWLFGDSGYVSMNCSPAQAMRLYHQPSNINSYNNMPISIGPSSNMPMGINLHHDISTDINPHNGMLLPQQEVVSKHPAVDGRQMGDGAAPPRNKRSHGSVESDSIPEGSSAAARRRRCWR